jgi:hypothetical protein
MAAVVCDAPSVGCETGILFRKNTGSMRGVVEDRLDEISTGPLREIGTEVETEGARRVYAIGRGRSLLK